MERRRGFTFFLAAVCVLLAIEVVVLALENRRLKRAHAAAAAEEQPASPQDTRLRFAPGDPFGELALLAADGRALPVAFDGGAERTLLFVFAPGCNACTLVAPTWNEIAAEVAAPALRVLAVQLDRSAPIPGDEGLAMPVHHLAEPLQVPLAKMTSVPITLVLDAAGIVEWVAYGVLGEARRAELVAFLGRRSG